MKKYLSVILSLFCLVFSSFFFVACNDKYEGMELSLNVQETLVIELDEDETKNYAYVDAIVSGSKQLCASVFSSTSDGIKITTQYLGEGLTRAKIEGIEPCETSIKVQTVANNISKYFTILVIRPLESITLKDEAVTYSVVTNKNEDIQRIHLLNENFKFEPSDSSETAVRYSLDRQYSNISIDGEYLVVEGEITQPTKIAITVTSVKRENISTVFEYTLLPNYNLEDNKVLGLDNDGAKTLIRNNKDKNSATISVNFVNLEGYKIIPSHIIFGDTVVTSSSSIDTQAFVTSYKLNFSAVNVGKSTVRVYATYENYPSAKVEVCNFEMITKDEVTEIRYTLQQDGDYRSSKEIDVYSSYGQNEQGQRIYFMPYPAPAVSLVPTDEMTMVVSIDEDTASNYIFYDYLGEEINKNNDGTILFEIITGKFISVKSKNSTAITGKVFVTSKAYEQVNLTLSLNPNVGVQDFYFEDNGNEVSKIILSSNEEQVKVIDIVTTPENADIRNISLEQEGNGFIASIDGKQITIKSVAGAFDQQGTLRVTFPNKHSKVLTVETFNELLDEDLTITSASGLDTSNVAYYNLDEKGNVSKIIVKNSSIIPLYFKSQNNARILNVDFSYADLEDVEDLDSANFLLSSTNVNAYISSAKYYLSTKETGLTAVKAQIKGYALDDNGQKVEKTYERIFVVEVYNPLRSVELDKYEILLYADESLGYYDKNHSEGNFKLEINKNLLKVDNYEINVYPDSQLIRDYLSYELDDSISLLDFPEMLIYNLTAHKYDENYKDITITLSVTEKFKLDSFIEGKTLSASVTVSINNAVKVQKVELKNIAKKVNDNSVNGQIYIDLTSTNITSYPILTNILPENALNKNLNYEFVANSGTASDILTISSDGIIKLSSNNVGGSGYIRITPVDRFVNNNGIIEPDNLNENVSLLIDLYIADGKTENTAKYIYSLNEIANSEMHYKLIYNAYLSNSTLNLNTANVLENFNGGLYGALNGGIESPTITIEGRTLFGQLNANAIVKNLIVVGSGEGQGLVCNENNGKIENVVVDAILTTTYLSSRLVGTEEYVGGITGTNNGTISNCHVNISITATEYVGGIAGFNSEDGVISDSSFNFYTFEGETHNTLSATYVGGLVGKNDGSLTSSNVNYYYNETSPVSLVASGTSAPVDCKVQIIESNFDATKFIIQKTDISFIEQDSKAIFKFYSPNITGLTASELNAFNLLNTISFKNLFGINENEINQVRVISTDNSVITTTSNSLTVIGVGEVVLKIFSKTNYSLAKEIQVKVMYYFSDFYMEISGVRVGEGSSVYVKYGETFTFKSTLENSVIAVDRSIPLKQSQDFVVNFSFVKNEVALNAPSVTGSELGIHSFVVTEPLDSLVDIRYSLTFKDSSEYNDILSQNTSDYMTLDIYNGAQDLTINANKIELQPTESYPLQFSFISDASEESISLSVVNGKGEKENDLFIVTSNLISKTEVSGKTDYYKYVYEILVSVKIDNNKLNNEETYTDTYTLIITPNSLNNLDTIDNNRKIEIKLLPQGIISMESSHHLPVDTDYVGFGSASYNYKSSNVLTPGTSGMLAVSLFPSYADFDYLTITSSASDGYKVGLRLLQKEGDVYSDANINLYTRIGNGIRVDKNVIKAISNNTNDMGMIYIKTILSQEVSIDTNFEITIQPYIDNNPLEINEIYILQAKYLDEARIYVNDSFEKSYLAKYSQAELKVVLPIDQYFDTADISITASDIEDKDYELSVFTESFDYNKGLKIYTATLKTGSSDSYQIGAKVNWVVNGRYEVKYTSHKVNVLDFIIENGTQLAVDYNDKDVFNAYVDVKKKLDFVFNATYNKEKNGEAYSLFTQNHYFVKEYSEGNYIVNKHNGYDYDKIDDLANYGNYLDNLYFVDGNTETSVKNQINDFVIFHYDEATNSVYIEGKASGTVNLRFRMAIVYPDGYNRNIEFDFTINVSVYTDEELPRIIRNELDFLNIEKEAEAQDYILVDNIVLNNYSPISTEKINSLDGNNYSIIIRNFADQDDNASNVEYALFNEVTSNTLIKNVTVNYHYLNSLTISNTSSLSSIRIAGFAIVNNGLIYNSEVVAFKQDEITSSVSNYGLNVRYGNSDITSSVSSIVAGFVIENNSTGTITNSRVGGTQKTIINDDTFNSVETISLQPFVISAQGDIAGFVYTNSGNISSSFFNNAYINNNSLSDYTTITSGFVVNNNSGQIVMSYARGVYSNLNEVHASKYGISSVGISSGFVYNNRARISDCYSNIRLVNNNTAGRAAAGFVYNNTQNGVIENCYSASQIKFNTTTQMNFSGVGENQEFLNSGEIKNSYYFDQSIELKENNTVSSPSVEEYFDTPAVRIEVVNNSESYYGFAFSSLDEDNGVWTIKTNGPELIEANKISISKRNYIPYEDEETYSLIYVDGYNYGSKNNPIIIRDALEFNEVFGNSSRTSVKEYYDLSAGVVFGSYRLINDIDFSSFSKDVVLNSSKLSLARQLDVLGNARGIASFEGNGLTIKNISMSASRDITDNFGLFKTIENGASFKNTNIILGKVDAQGTAYGISAGDVSCVGAVAGTLSDSNLFNVKVSAIQSQTSIKIEGQNLVGGIVGKAVGKLRINNVTSENISVKALQTAVLDYVRTANVNRYSFAGGLFGVLDTYSSIDQTTSIVSDRDITSEVLKLAVKGNMQIEGGIVGGITGYLGPVTHVQDALFELGDGVSSQKLIAYNNGYAGGIVGLNKGLLNQVRAEHGKVTQTKIEDGIDAYYASASSTREGNYYLFYSSDYSPSSIGGLVGHQSGGEIYRSYSKINVNSINATHAGGLIGYASTKVKITEAYTISDVYSKKFMGGIVGYSKAENLDLYIVNAFNYWSKDLLLNPAIKLDDNGYLVGQDSLGGIDAICPNIILNNISTSIDVYANNKINVIVGSNIKTVNIKVSGCLESELNNKIDVSYSMTDSKQDRIEKASYTFSINENKWSKLKWQRAQYEQFNSMKFIVTSEVYYINTYEDLQLMNVYTDATFIINRMVDCSSFTNHSFRISYFSGTLKAKDDIGDYGFKNLNLSNPLFTNAYGASFLGFKIQYDSNSSPQNDKNAVLIQNARSVSIKNLEFKNVTLNSNYSTNGASGIVVAKITGGKNEINGLTFKSCQMNVYGSSKKYTAGMVIGESESAVSLTISNVNMLEADGVLKSNELRFYNKNEDADATSRVGLIIGYSAGDISIDSQYSSETEEELKSNSVISANLTICDGTTQNSNGENEINNANIYVGGLVGQTSNSATISKIDIKNSIINAYSTKNMYAGGLVGSSNSITMGNNNVSNTNFNVTSLSSSENSTFVGGLVGELKNLGQFNDTTTLSSSYNTIVNCVGNSSNIAIGGLVGQFEGVSFSCTRKGLNEIGGQSDTLAIQNYSNLTLNSNAETNGATIYSGGIFGRIKSNAEKEVSLEKLLWIGRTTINSLPKNSTVYFGGIVGKAETTNNNPILLSNNYVAGDLYIYNKNLGDTDKLYVGGIVGLVNESVPTKNYSMMTLFANQGKYNYSGEKQEYNVGAIIGKSYTELTKLNDEDLNIYSSSICLTSESDLIAKNIKYSNIIEEFAEYVSLTDEDGRNDGTKFNPYIIGSFAEIKESASTGDDYDYYCFEYEDDSNTIFENNSYELKDNIFLASSAVLNQNNSYLPLFDSISSKAVVSGITYKVEALTEVYDGQNIDNEQALFARLNNGIIFGCSTVMKQYDLTITGNYSNGISGFVAQNSQTGTISQCYSNVNIRNDFGSSVFGFVGGNNGYVLDCYSSGELKTNGNIYAFGNGKCINCYTTAQIHHKDIDSSAYYLFSDLAKNYYYDATATQYSYGEDAHIIKTNDFAIDFSDSNSEALTATLKEKFKDINLSIWSFDKQFNFGYPMLNVSQYNLANTEEKNSETYYHISSLGKLEQIQSDTSKNYKLIRDLYGNFGLSKKYSFETIANEFTGKLTGGYSKIKYNQDISGSNVGEGIEIEGAYKNIDSVIFTNGIFKSLNGAAIDKLSFSNNNLVVNNNGGLITSLMQNGSVSNIQILTNLEIDIQAGTETIYSVGGIVGSMSGGNISSTLTNSFINVSSFANSNAKTLNFGGIVGNLEGGTVTACFNVGEVGISKLDSAKKTISGSLHNVGGIAGNMSAGEINQSANKSIVIDASTSVIESYVGGLVGNANSNASISDCYNSGYVIANAQEIQNTDYNTSDMDTFKSTYRNGEIKYGLFTTKAYAGGISGQGGNIKNVHNSDNPIIKNSKTLDEKYSNLSLIYEGNIVGGYQIFKPYEISITKDLTAQWATTIGAVAVGVLLAVLAVYTGGYSITILTKLFIVSGGIAGGAVGYLGVGWYANSFALYQGNIVINEICYWNTSVSTGINQKNDNSDARTVAEIIYDINSNDGLYLTMFNQAKEKEGSTLTNVYTSFVAGIANNANLNENCQVLTSSYDYRDSTPEEFNNLLKLDNGSKYVQLDICEQLGINSNEATDLSYIDYSKFGDKWTEDGELNSYLNVNYKAQELTYKEEYDDNEQVIKVYEVYDSSQLWQIKLDYDKGDSSKYKGNIIRLQEDISLSTHSPWDGISGFDATFDGNGKSIKNLNTTNGNGLFKSLNSAVVKNLTLAGAIYNENANSNIGLLANTITGNSSVIDSTFTANINSTTIGESNIGGLVGFVDRNATLNVDNNNFDIVISSYSASKDGTQTTTVSSIIGNADSSTASISISNNNVALDVTILSIGNVSSDETKLVFNLFAPTSATITENKIIGTPRLNIGSSYKYELDYAKLDYNYVLANSLVIEVNTNKYNLLEHNPSSLLVNSRTTQDTSFNQKDFEAIFEYNDEKYITMISEAYSKEISAFKLNGQEFTSSVYKKSYDISYITFNIGNAYSGNSYEYAIEEQSIEDNQYYELIISYLNLKLDVYYNTLNSEVINAYITNNENKIVKLFVEPKIFGLDNLVITTENGINSISIDEDAQLTKIKEEIIKMCYNATGSVALNGVELSSQAFDTIKVETEQNENGEITKYTTYPDRVSNKIEIKTEKNNEFSAHKTLGSESFVITKEIDSSVAINDLLTNTTVKVGEDEIEYQILSQYRETPRNLVVEFVNEELILSYDYDVSFQTASSMYRYVYDANGQITQSQNKQIFESDTTIPYYREELLKTLKTMTGNETLTTNNLNAVTYDGTSYYFDYNGLYRKHITTITMGSSEAQTKALSSYETADELQSKIGNIGAKNEKIYLSLNAQESKIDSISKVDYYTERNFGEGKGPFTFEYEKIDNATSGKVGYNRYLYTENEDVIKKYYEFDLDNQTISVSYSKYDKNTSTWTDITEYEGYDLDTGLKIDNSVYKNLDIKNSIYDSIEISLDLNTVLKYDGNVFSVIETYIDENNETKIKTIYNCVTFNNNILTLSYNNHLDELIIRRVALDSVGGLIINAKEIINNQ